MKESPTDHTAEFKENVGQISDAIHQVSDPVAIATMLYNIAEEKKSSNLVVRDINQKLDQLTTKLEEIIKHLKKLEGIKTTPQKTPTPTTELSHRDQEILDFVSKKGKACADEVQTHFQYRGRNAASARLSRLFKDGILEKVYVGRRVYYTLRK